MSAQYLSGIAGSNPRSDCIVRYRPRSTGGLKITIESKVAVMYGEAIREQAGRTLAELGVAAGGLEIEDFGALPYVLQARIEAAVKAALPELDRTSLPALTDFGHPPSRRDRFRRSRLYLPGAQPKFMLNAGIHRPDAIILDLEDAVGPPEKLSARLIVRNALRVLDFFGAERMVRINQGALGRDDLTAIVPQPVDLILIPKVETAHQVVAVDEHITALCRACGREEPPFLMPILESAKGILNAQAIADASPHNVALAIGLEDYSADLGVARTAEGVESAFARSMVVNAARSAGLQASDSVFSDVGDRDGLWAAATNAKALGFDGMGAIHPRQIAVIHEAFAPTDEELEQAKTIVLAFDEAEAQGLGVVSLGTKMIDAPVVQRAERTVELAVALGKLAKGWRKAGPAA
ncbi:MAG: citrate lyase ACP [Candidatus Marinimicrobia bacterium]|nr:citrate lyase ACP [Candidatus Neomarinimicrobiota bacterium]